MLDTNVHIARKHALYSYKKFIKPLKKVLSNTPVLKSRGNKPLQMTFEDQLNGLIYFYLQ